MNKKKLLFALEFVGVISIFKIIYDYVFMPITLKLDNSFTVFVQSDVGNFISWIVIVSILVTVYEAIIKPLIKKLLRKK